MVGLRVLANWNQMFASAVQVSKSVQAFGRNWQSIALTSLAGLTASLVSDLNLV